MMDAWILHVPAALSLALGIAFGWTVARTDWCTMGAISDILLMGDWRRMRSWLLALAVALAGTQALAAAGLVEIGSSPYAAGPGSLLGVVAGGLMFGFGMTQTGGCISKNLVRAGGGSIKAVVVLLIVAASSLLVVAGPLAWLLPAPPQAIVRSAAATAASGRAILPLLGMLGAAAILVFCLKDAGFRRSRPLLVAGLILGGLIPLGWLGAALLPWPGPPDSINFARALPAAVLELKDPEAVAAGFALVAGAMIGAFLAARLTGRFRVEAFAGSTDLKRNLGGALLMGVGGVLAGGCTVGQGLTGISTLAPAAVVALGAIVAGALAGVRYLEQGSLRGAVRALLAGG